MIRSISFYGLIVYDFSYLIRKAKSLTETERQRRKGALQRLTRK